MHRRLILPVIAWLLLFSGCARLPDTGKTTLKPASFGALQGYLLEHKADVDLFRLRGPYDVTEKDDLEIRLSTTEAVNTDLFLSAHPQKAPLVIILHGHESAKEDHRFQAMHVASWGLHTLAVQLPGHGPWIANGKLVAKLVNFVRQWPQIADNRIDTGRIVLVGHSYGAAAAAVALAEGAPAIGGILLDPATDERGLPAYLGKVQAPVIVIGADKRVSLASDRDYFYRYIRRGVAEISIRDAAHEDGQYPSRSAHATAELQVTFVAALTAAALSVSSTGNFDFAWASYRDVVASGKFFDAKKK